jgi:hypothetical protein
MGIPTLISTATETDVASIDITSGIDSTYDEYMFVMTNINPATDDTYFSFQVNAAAASGFNETITSTCFIAQQIESGGSIYFDYHTGFDQAEGTAYQHLSNNMANDADQGMAGILHLFSPSSTTYVKHFYARTIFSQAGDYAEESYYAGYINTTSAIDEISFKMASGNFDGVIQMYGIS